MNHRIKMGHNNIMVRLVKITQVIPFFMIPYNHSLTVLTIYVVKPTILRVFYHVQT